MASNGDPQANGSSFEKLRRPKPIPSKSELDPVDDLTREVGKVSLHSNQSAKSNGLNPQASVFVPRSVAQPETMPDLIPQQTPFYNNNDEHVMNGASSVSWPPGLDPDAGDLETDDYFALSELKEFIDQVSSTPHLYDVYIDNITELLNTCIDEDEEIVLQCIVNTIIDQAIIDQNFRYSGVRLSEHLMRKLQMKQTKRTFRDELLSRCQREHSRRETLAKSATPEGKDHLRGAVLFIADLCTRVSEQQLINYLPDFVDTLLNHTSAENIKTACLVLKLCGPTLEPLSRDLDKTEVKLKALCENQPANVAAVIKNVLELKERGWKAPPLPADFVNPYADGNFPPGDLDVPGAVGFENNYYPPGYVYPGIVEYGYPPQYDFGECGDDANDEVVGAFEDFLRASGQTR